jgi:hypothetical protein
MAPSNCGDDLVVQQYCSDYTAGILSGGVEVSFFAVVDKADYPTIDSLLAKYTDFAKWPDYVAATGRTAIIFNQSLKLESLPASQTSNEVLRHYADYKIDSPLGYQDVRVVTHNVTVDPYEGALGSVEFEVQTEGMQDLPVDVAPLEGAVGVKSQTGNVHVVDCAKSDLCTDERYLLIYQSKIVPEIDLLPKLAAGPISEGIESILIGMFLIDNADDGDVL